MKPVEYAVAVDRYLDAASLGEQSARVYRIALAGWGWPLVDRDMPTGSARRSAVPPTVPLALLDDERTPELLEAALRERRGSAHPRTVSRELSILRGAVRWWRRQGWIDSDPTEGLRAEPAGIEAATLSRADVAAVFALPAALREQAYWHLLYDTSAATKRLLALDAEEVDPLGLAMGRRSDHDALVWSPATARLMSLLLAGRARGPVFVTDRRARATIPDRDRCPYTGRARLSYRRAAELFTAATKPVDTTGSGWTLHQLGAAGRAHRGG